jgi:hypothetical protein
MKTIKFLLLVASISLLPVHGYCDWGDTKGIFKGQKDIEIHLSDLSAGMATIAYNGKLWNFVNYGDGAKVIVRTLSNKSKNTTEVYWDCSQNDADDNLKGMNEASWQPAPVVFNEALYLFVYRKDGTIGYTTYDEIETEWKEVRSGPSGCRGNFMSAVVIYDKLYLLARDGNTQNIAIFWTGTPFDENSWQKMETIAKVGDYCSISAIVKSYPDTDSKINSKLQFAYVTVGQNVRFEEYSIDSTSRPVLIRDIVIADNHDYSSVVLAEGSIVGDSGSKGFCTQAFLKKDTKDNGYCRYRILRYQLIDGGEWTGQESNLVKQNYLWASHRITLTAANFPVMQADSSIRQFMCLIYRGYDDWNNPLNCAWAETDHLKYFGEGVEQKLTGPENTQYIGYIEGLPPFYANHASEIHSNDKYINKFNQPISAAQYNHAETSSTESTISYDVGAKIKCHYAGFKAEVGYTFGQKFGKEYEATIEQSFKMYANESEMFGLYIGHYPVINYMKYEVYDTKDSPLYPTFYFFITRCEKRVEVVSELQKGLIMGDPKSYMNRNLPYEKYNHYGRNSASWRAGLDAESSVEVKTTKFQTNTHKATVKLGVSFLPAIQVEVKGSFEYEITAKTVVGDKLTCFTAMNEAVDPTDVTALDYNIYWICPTSGKDNWWLKKGADPSQNTWCLTYEVTFINYKNGLGFGKPGLGVTSDDTAQITGTLASDSRSITGLERVGTKDASFSLVQNFPNPFRLATTIRYQVGSENQTATGAEQTIQIRLVVFNLNGQVVATLVNQRLEPGNYEVIWNASDIPPGIYFYSLDGRNFRDYKKMILLK